MNLSSVDFNTWWFGYSHIGYLYGKIKKVKPKWARRSEASYQYVISILLITVSSVICYLFSDFLGYQVVALILLLVVSISAMLFDIFPVLIAAILSALIWNFFFIPPTLTLHIGTPENVLMFLMYFVVATINAVLTFKIRQVEKRNRKEEEKVKSIKLYNTLLNSLSHELRTPISTIIGAIDTIKDTGSKLTEDNRKELYSEIEIAGFRLNRQVENLLNMSRLESGNLKPNLDWCDVNELVYTIIKNKVEEAGRHTIIFNHDEGLPLFKTDRGLLEQILHSIIQNALQHTPEDSTITITVQDKDGLCLITISDNGPGLPEEELELVFQKFYRVSDSGTGGTGLGLSIAKGFTEALNGTRIPASTSAIMEYEHEPG
jgi:two-component system sensor histidine kinase KdpD